MPHLLTSSPSIIISKKFISAIKRLFKHLGLWDIKARPPPKANAPPLNVNIDYSDSQLPPSEDYLYSDVDYPIEDYAS